MKFYNREKELDILYKTGKDSLTSAKMTVIVGRRRVGKTALIKQAFKNELYFFVSKKNEALLCEELQTLAQEVLNIKILGEFKEFAKLFEQLLIISQNLPFTLTIDEFQEFLAINPSIYSTIQNIWDSYKQSAKINLILCGSIYSLMQKIFEDKKEPLFGRANRKINLKPFNTQTLKTIFFDNSKNCNNSDLLAFYVLTGGVAKYVESFVDENVFTLDAMLDTILDEHSLFLEEGKNLLIEEFGKEYGTYFSVLSLLASSKTSRSEIESILEKNVGGYLDRLENEYSIIKKIKPIFAKEASRSVKYEIVDNFLAFWFRFIYKNKSAIEIQNFEYVRNIAKRDFSVFSGKFLERYFKDKLSLGGNYSQIGTYWDKTSNNEIDIVALNENEKFAHFYEVKLNKERIDLKLLQHKAQKLINSELSGYNIEYFGLSVFDM
ncbi:MAG: hypothetical protein RL154_9 [Pseudomonadota bacterium]|jgi:AAA+ ATPase superfamily predicted ATPase